MQRAQSDDKFRHASLRSNPLILDPAGQMLPTELFMHQSGGSPGSSWHELLCVYQIRGSVCAAGTAAIQEPFIETDFGDRVFRSTGTAIRPAHRRHYTTAFLRRAWAPHPAKEAKSASDPWNETMIAEIVLFDFTARNNVF